VVLLLGTELGEAVVADLDHLVDLLRRLAEALERRLRIGEDLLVVLVLVDDALAEIEIVERRQRAHALAHVLIVAGNLRELVEELLGKEVGIGVDPHRGDAPGLASAWIALISIVPAGKRGGRSRVC
jgi:hypothetical protein